MDALFTDEEQQLADTVRGLVARSVPATVPELEAFDDRTLWASLAEGDLLGLGIPERVGGVGTMLDASIVMRTLGSALAPTPYLGATWLAAQLLARAGADRAVMDGHLSGRLRLAVGLDVGLGNLARIGHDDEVVAFDAAGAVAALVLNDDGALTALALGERRAGLDLTRQLITAATHQRVEIGDLGGPLIPDELQAWTAAALVGVASDLAGAMEGAVALGVTHASTRHQFGVPIGSFQALAHLVADAYVDVDGARGLVNFAAWSLDNAAPADATRAAVMAKAYCSEVGKRVTEAVIQVHGGMGMTWDCLAHVYQRRILADRTVFGDEHVHYRSLARG